MIWTPSTAQIKQMLDIYMGADKCDIPPHRSRTRVARVVYVTESEEQACRELADVELGSPLRSGRLDHYIPENGTRDDLTMAKLIMSDGFFVGSPDTVEEGLKNFYYEVGGFGTGRSVADWQEGLAERLAEKYRVVGIDYYGHGLSERSHPCRYGSARWAEQAVDVLDAVGRRRV